jgi:hypothetical protein
MRFRIFLRPVLTFTAAFLVALACISPAVRSLGYEYKTDLPALHGLSSPEEILGWVRRNIRYQPEDTDQDQDYWQTPEETLERGFGDCEDISLLFMYLCRQNLKVEPRLLLVADASQETYNHTLVEVEGAWYDPSAGSRVSRAGAYRVFYRFSYARSLWMAERYHAGVIQTWKPAVYPALSRATAPGEE